MSEILVESLGTSRYAPVDVNAYQYNGLEGLSFGQLIMAVCCRRAAAIEQESLIKMNQMNATNDWLDQISGVAERLFTADKISDADRTVLVDKCGLDEDELKKDDALSSYAKRVALFEQIKSKIDNATTLSQEQAVALQSLVSRRDVTYNTSAATVKTLMQSALSMAAAIG